VTLSYVWGNVAEPSSTDPNKLSKEAPQLIQDAMEVTRRLGYKYLWVDRYCIPQDDVAAKHTQIQNMNEIYAKSALTIIASAGTSPCDGLPGVSIERSPRQETVVVRNRRFTQIMTNIVPEIQSSVWNSRGWTYQEGLLSSRKLAFSNNQWYFQCSGMWCIEGFAHALEDMHAKNRQHFPLPENQRPSLPVIFPCRGVGVSMDEHDVWERIREFWPRKLSFQSDALDAFRGILRAFENYRGRNIKWRSRYWGHICGLPVMSCSDVSSKVAVIHTPLLWPHGSTLLRIRWSLSSSKAGGLARRRKPDRALDQVLDNELVYPQVGV
jgi:hypothetical protein